MIGIVKPADTERFNSEPATDPTIERVLSFEALGQCFEVRLQVPCYIDGKLLAEDWDFVEKHVRARAEDLRRMAALSGAIFDPVARQQLTQHVSQFARNALYQQFMKYQVRAGNHEGHEVPRSLQ